MGAQSEEGQGPHRRVFCDRPYQLQPSNILKADIPAKQELVEVATDGAAPVDEERVRPPKHVNKFVVSPLLATTDDLRCQPNTSKANPRARGEAL